MNSVPQKISISETYGASYIGAMIAAALYGLTTLQVYFYYVYYPKDRPSLKLLVYLTWFLDTLHMAVVAYCIYYYLVINYNNPPALAVGHWTLFTSVAVSTIIAVIGRCYFTQKVYALCPKNFKVFVTTLIGFTIVGHLAFGIVTVVLLFVKKELARFAEIRFIAFTPFVIMAVSSDLLIAISLCTLLWGNKPSFRSSASNTIISKLIVYAINRCLLTSLVATGALIAFYVAPQALWFLAMSFIIAKLYANSLLATLNSRQTIRNINHDTVNTVHLSQLEFQRGSASRTAQQDQIGVNLQYETRIDVDRMTSGSKTTVSGNSSDAGLVRMYKV